MKVVRIPKAFFIHHCDRDLPAPEVVKETKHHFWIRADDPEMHELRSDAEYYLDIASNNGWTDQKYMFGLLRSAKATLAAIRFA